MVARLSLLTTSTRVKKELAGDMMQMIDDVRTRVKGYDGYTAHGGPDFENHGNNYAFSIFTSFDHVKCCGTCFRVADTFLGIITLFWFS